MTLWHNLTQETSPTRRRTRTRRSDPQDVPLRELFPPSFMEAHTTFASFGDMLRSGSTRDPSREAWRVAFRDPAWEEHVRRTTRFTSWREMRTAAAAAHVRK